MKGKYSVFVQNNRLRYEFTISRNITIIRVIALPVKQHFLIY